MSRPNLRTPQLLERLAQPFGDECVLWWGCKNNKGYGHLKVDGKVKAVHRIVLEHKLGEVLGPDIHACHTCDTPSCINPKHLFAGTQTDNSRDMVTKGRAFKAQGTLNAQAKLTEDDVKNIRKQLCAGTSQQELARSYGVDASTISLIHRNKKWRHLV